MKYLIVCFILIILGFFVASAVIIAEQPTAHVTATKHKPHEQLPLQPAKQAGQLTTVYTRGNIAYQVMTGNSFVDHGKIVSALFDVTYINLTNQPVTVTGKQFSLGCIVANGQSFHANPAVFANGGFGTLPARTTSLAVPVTLEPLGQSTVSIQLDGSCQDIGTEDGQYWWAMTAVQ